MARAHRRRQAGDALEYERERADSLREEIERLVAELEAPAIDEEAFARMAPGDAALVRVLVQPVEGPEPEGDPAEDAWLIDGDDADAGEQPDPRAEIEEEIVRLEEEIAESRRLQEALESYLAALE